MKLAPPLCLALVLTCAAARAQAPVPADERAIWDTEFAWNKAYVDGDAAKLASIEDKAYVYTDGDGTVHTKADKGQTEALAGKMHFTEMSLHEAVVRISGDTAIVTGRLVVSGGLKETFGEIDKSTDTLVLRDGAWKALGERRRPPRPDGRVLGLPHLAGGRLAQAPRAVRRAGQEGQHRPPLRRRLDHGLLAEPGKAVWDKYYGNLRPPIWDQRGPDPAVLWPAGQRGDRRAQAEGRRPDDRDQQHRIRAGRADPEEHPGAGRGRRGRPSSRTSGSGCPDSKILLLAVFPRSHLPTNPARLQVQEINRRIAGLGDGDHVRYLDIGDRFLTKDGVLEKDIMPDYLHPSVRGYEIWAQAIQQPLSEMLGSVPDPGKHKGRPFRGAPCDLTPSKP